MAVSPVRLLQQGEPARRPSTLNRPIQDILFGSGYSPDGSDFAGFQRIGGSVLGSGALRNVMDFSASAAIGDGSIDALPAFIQADADASITGGGIIYVPRPSIAYSLSGPLAISPNNTILTDFGAVIQAMPGYSADHLIELMSGSSVDGATLECANLPAPTGNWLGVGNPKGCPIIADGTTAAVLRPRLVQVRVRNAPNGGLFFRLVTNPYLSRVSFENVQTSTAFVRSAGLEYYQVTDGVVLDCEINGYTMKGYNLGNSKRVRVVRSHAFGGAQNIGHASHYEDGCTDCSYIDCNHEGVGFGYKSHSGIRPKLIRFTGDGSAGLAYFQGSVGFTMDDCQHIGDAASRQHIIVEGEASAGPVLGGLINNCRGSRSVAGTTLNHIGVHFIAAAGKPVQDVTVRDCTFTKQYVPVWTQNATGAEYSNIEIENLRTITPTSNSCLLFAKSVRLHDCKFDPSSDGSTPLSMFSASGVPSKRWEVIDNKFFSLASSDEAMQIGYDLSNTFGVRLDILTIRGNESDGGNVLCRIDLSNTAGGAGTNYIKHLAFDGNSAHDIGSANAVLITLATVLKTRLRIVGNSLIDAALLPKNILLNNAAQVQGGYAAANDINQITNWPASFVAGLYGVIPVPQAAAIASPILPSGAYVQAEATSAKTAIDDLRIAIKNLGGTA